MELAVAKEDEVNTAYTAFKKARRRAKKKGKTIPLDFPISRCYKLFSTQHAEWAYNDSLSSAHRAAFHYINDPDDPPLADGEGKPLFGDISLDDAEAYCQFGPIQVPTRARRKDVKITSIACYEQESHDLRFKFFGDKYLKLSVPRALVFPPGYKMPLNAPERFEFVGILRDYKKEEKERAETLAAIKKNRAPSPRDSFFERTHFMGSYNSNWWRQQPSYPAGTRVATCSAIFMLPSTHAKI